MFQNTYMQHPSKIQLSPEEKELLNNTQWILTKHAVIQKVYEMLGHISELLKEEIFTTAQFLPPEAKRSAGKISKGENYKSMPYVILDHPAVFNKENILAVRTMFWWGNFFSTTLHLKGIYKMEIRQLHASLSYLQKNNFFICINEDEWQHNFEEENFKPASSITEIEFMAISRKPFIKIAKKISLPGWDVVPEFVLNTFKEMMEWIQISFQDGKKDLLPGTATNGSGL